MMLRNRMDAEEVTQDVLISLWKNIDGINLNAVKSWLYRTTYNRCMDYLRKRTLAYKREILIDEDLIENIPDSIKGLDIELEKKLDQEKILVLLERIPENQRNVLILYTLNELKYREISNILNMPINTVKVNLLRARQNLIKEWKREGRNV